MLKDRHVQKIEHQSLILEGILPINKSQIPSDILAGVILAAVCIPQAIGYTKIAGMPVVTGLYTILLPLLLFTIFGSSRHLFVGADSATAAILAAGLVGIAVAGSTAYVGLASATAIATGLLLLVARVLRLGFLADFLSRTVIVGFLAGIGIDVAVGEIGGMLGLSSISGQNTILKLVTVIQQISHFSLMALSISAGVLAMILIFRLISRKIPGMLVAVVSMIILSWGLNLQEKGLAVIGPIQGGLPSLSLPSIEPGVLPQLLPTVFALFIVIIAQSAALTRGYASRHRESLNENGDLLGLAMANIGAGLSGTFVVNGGASQTEAVDHAGAKSQLAQIVTVLLVVIILVYFTVPLSYLPIAVLSAIVFVIGIELIDIGSLKDILAKSPGEFFLALATIMAVVFVGVGEGIIFAIILSLFYHVRLGYKPKDVLIVTDASGNIKTLPITSAAQMLPGLIIYRFNHSMYYANADHFKKEILDLVETAPTPVTWFCIEFTAVYDVDVTAGETLEQIQGVLEKNGIRLVFAEVGSHARSELDRMGVTEKVGKDAYFNNIFQVIDVYRNMKKM